MNYFGFLKLHLCPDRNLELLWLGLGLDISGFVIGLNDDLEYEGFGHVLSLGLDMLHLNFGLFTLGPVFSLISLMLVVGIVKRVLDSITDEDLGC